MTIQQDATQSNLLLIYLGENLLFGGTIVSHLRSGMSCKIAFTVVYQAECERISWRGCTVLVLKHENNLHP